MKNKYIFAVLLIYISNLSYSQVSSRWNIALEANVASITNNIGMKRIGYQGLIGVNYLPSQKLSLGLYYSWLKDGTGASARSFYQIDGRIIDLSTSEIQGFGLGVGYKLYQEQRFSVIPQLRLGYNIYSSHAANFNMNAGNNIMSVHYFSLQPMIHFEYKFSRINSFGLTGGYTFPMLYMKRSHLDEYNVNNINAGIFIKTYF